MNLLTEDQVRTWIDQNIDASEYKGKSLLLIIPDHTRTAPLPLLFDALYQKLRPHVTQFDVMVALGTHPPMSEQHICQLLGIKDSERERLFFATNLFNHEWDNEDALTEIGRLSEADTLEISDGLLAVDVPVKINKRIRDYDNLLVLGPVFPHEVVGFSGGNKYFFPGISGPELLNFFHWLGALVTNAGIIGVKSTPVRKVVDKAAALIPNFKRALTFVVAPDKSLYGLFYGTPEDAWSNAADLSSQVHITWVDKPYKQVLSCAPPMYDELWVAGKCMYKLEPAVADGGEVIIYAPHLSSISVVHEHIIKKIGYHCRDYFVKQWDQFKHMPWGTLAHSTHVRGAGEYDPATGIEKLRVNVILATQIPEEVCKQINLGYRDPATINVESFANREAEGVLLVRKAGEQLFRLKGERGV
ncbi:nickel-dependent lactate racemase family protein [Lacunimicrobium album]